MAEWIAPLEQTVNGGADVLFSIMTVNTTNCNITHRQGSGLFTLKGITKGQCRARYRVHFQANIALPEGGTPGEISLTIAVDGEPQTAYLMAVTPTAAEAFNNIAGYATIDVPCGCCQNISIQNTSFDEAGTTQVPIVVRNASIDISRVA